MVFYVNQHLIDDEVTGSSSWTTRDGITEEFDRVAIKTAGGATRVVDGKPVPTNIIICRHSVAHEPDAKTRIRNLMSEDGQVRTRIQTSVVNKYDDDIFVVALPYDGLVVPMENKPDDLAVWRYVIQKSSSMNIEHNDRKYRRVLYLVVSPRGTPDADGWYPEECNLVVSTIKSNLSKDARESGDLGNAKWTVTTNTVRFGATGAFEISTETETVPYDVYAHVADNVRAAVVDTIPPLPPKGEGNNGGNRGPRPNNGGPKKPVKQEPKNDYPAGVTMEDVGGGKKRRKKRHRN